jgi:hypothetical protein
VDFGKTDVQRRHARRDTHAGIQDLDRVCECADFGEGQAKLQVNFRIGALPAQSRFLSPEMPERLVAPPKPHRHQAGEGQQARVAGGKADHVAAHRQRRREPARRIVCLRLPLHGRERYPPIRPD